MRLCDVNNSSFLLRSVIFNDIAIDKEKVEYITAPMSLLHVYEFWEFLKLVAVTL